MSTPYDFVAVGLGPFNLGLACLSEPVPDLQGVFLEREPEFNWHAGMLLEHSTLQTPFLSDLVTLADPTSPYSFLNYLKHSGRLYPFYIRESFYPLRSEFNDYCRWAAAQLDGLRFGRRVTSVEYDPDEEVYRVRTQGPDGGATTYLGRSLVLGTGTVPFVPESCRGLGGDAVHSSAYLRHREQLRGKDSITVVGSGQSAAEIVHDLLSDIDSGGYILTWITRSPRFFPLEYTKLTLEMTSPDYVDHFHGLDPATRERLVAAQAALYKGIDSSLVNAIYDLLYTKSRSGAPPVTLRAGTAVTTAWHDAADGTYTLSLHEPDSGAAFEHRSQGLVLATGYRREVPDFLDPIRARIRWDAHDRFAVRRDYSVDRGETEERGHGAKGGIFVQNAELHTHGFTAPDLGMAAHRNSWIIAGLLGREYYPIERAIAFQAFGAPEGAAAGKEVPSA